MFEEFDHIRVLAENLDFHPMAHEHILGLPTTLSDQLLDVLLTLHGRLAPLNPSGVPTGCHDVRLYLDNRDVTASYMHEVRQLLKEHQHTARTQYDVALRSWLGMLAAVPGNYGVDLEAARSRAAELVATEPFENLLDSLGHTDAGWSGHLHLFNFLYTQVQIPPVSLVKVSSRYNQANAPEKGLDPARIAKLTVSSGPCRLYEDHWSFSLARGSVYVMAEFRHHNPLVDRLARLEAKVNELESSLKESLEEIADAVGPHGEIQSRLNNVNQASIRLGTATERIEGHILGQAQELKALRVQVDALKSTL